MSTRCKPGDIAIITREVTGCEANVGRMVHVRGPDEIDKQGRLTWLITPVDPETPWLVGDGKGGTYIMKVGDMSIEHPDDWMAPVRSDDLAKSVARELGLPVSKVTLDRQPARVLIDTERRTCYGTLQTR